MDLYFVESVVMALLLLASAWYIALVSIAASAAWNAHRRRRRDAKAGADAQMTYEERRDHARAEHLASVRQEELAELRRRERRLSHA